MNASLCCPLSDFEQLLACGCLLNWLFLLPSLYIFILLLLGHARLSLAAYVNTITPQAAAGSETKPAGRSQHY